MSREISSRVHPAGTLTLRRDGDRWQGTLDFSTRAMGSDGSVRVLGEFWGLSYQHMSQASKATGTAYALTPSATASGKLITDLPTSEGTHIAASPSPPRPSREVSQKAPPTRPALMNPWVLHPPY